MICQNSIGHDKQIHTLLEKACLNMDKTSIDAWMKYKYNPKRMFCLWQDDQITSCLQVQERNMIFKGKQMRISYLDLACTLPDYRQRKQFSSLLEGAIQQATYNDLVTMAYTNMPRLYESKSFQTISTTKEYWISEHQCKKGKSYRIHHNTDHLYTVYFEFMQYFDGSILLSKEEFDQTIQYYRALKKEIVTMYNDDNEIRGFAIYSSNKDQAHIEVLIYFDTQAIQDLLTYLSLTHHVISILTSESERFDKLFPQSMPRTNKKIIARLNNYKLFDKWTNSTVRNAKEAFFLLEKPQWNHFL